MLITKTYVISFLLHFIYWWINSLCPCLCLFSMGSQLEGILAPFYFHFNVFEKGGGVVGGWGKRYVISTNKKDFSVLIKRRHDGPFN